MQEIIKGIPQMMEKISLNGVNWQLLPDPENKGMNEDGTPCFAWLEENKGKGRQVNIPGSWQTIPGLERYEGVCWYFTSIPAPVLEKAAAGGHDISINFGAANYLVKAWLSGEFLGEHEGGYLPFTFKLKERHLKRVVNGAWKGGSPGDEGKVQLLVRVDNTRRKDQIPEFSTDWFNWGGIYRPVFLAIKPRLHVKRCLVTPHLDFEEDGRVENAWIDVRVDATGPMEVSWRVFPAGDDGNILVSGRVAIQGRTVVFSSKIPEPRPWTPENPFLYTIVLHGEEGSELIRERFGLRTIETRGASLLLNGRPVRLKGCSLHEERYPHGREYPVKARREELLQMKALGFNFLRTAHYSHCEALMELADEIGMLIGEEVPVYWDIEYKNPKIQRLAAKMLRDLVYRDFNHPSVIWWSAGNEVPTSRRECQLFFKTMLSLIRHLDPSRLAVFVSKTMVADPVRKYSDAVLFNGYFGWYVGSTRFWPLVTEMIHGTATRKPVIISEFGAGALLGHGRHEPLDEKFSEWKQASIVSHAIKAFNSKPFIAGWAIWIYRDFKSHMRLNKFQQGYNRKGIVDEKNRKKMLAIWMPRLVNQKLKRNKMHSLLGIFLSKFLYPAAMAISIIIDTLLPRFTRTRNEGYYTREVGPAFHEHQAG